MALLGTICMILIGVGIAIFFSSWIIYGLIKFAYWATKPVRRYLARTLDE